MKLLNSYIELEQTKVFNILRRTTQEVKEIEDSIIVENLLSVYINGELSVKMICSPSNLAELVLGYIYSERIIQSTNDVELIDICEFGRRAIVRLSETAQNRLRYEDNLENRRPVKQIKSGCNEVNVIDGIMTDLSSEELFGLPQHEWKPEDIFQQAAMIMKESTLFITTGGAHSCSIVIKDKKNESHTYLCEDIGRHNAVDKVIGCALRDGFDLSRGSLFTSGRIPADMALKAIKSGIPIIASHSAPTDKAIELARRYGLTLIGFTRGGRMNVYS